MTELSAVIGEPGHFTGAFFKIYDPVRTYLTKFSGSKSTMNFRAKNEDLNFRGKMN